MHVVVSGASGYVGTELLHHLAAAGHTVVRLVRRAAQGPSESRWSPSAGVVDQSVIDSADAVINLSGASLARLPWTPRYRREMLSSRLTTTATLATAIAASSTPPAVYLSGSAVGFYGNRADEELTEASSSGSGVRADIVIQWEAAAKPAEAATRVVLLRTGIVVGHGGAFTPLERLTRLGLGARLGTGTAFWPWISLHDEAAAIVHLLGSKLEGPVNLVGPSPATSDEITRALATAMRRPRIWPVPGWAVELALGDAGRELILSGERVLPARLLEDRFAFRDETVETAIRAAWPARA
jgi:uncharacterized protein (TIGR01777 family)